MGRDPKRAKIESETRAWALGLGLALLTFLTYRPVLGNGFVNYDDPVYVTANPQVRAGLSWAGAAWAFRSTVAANWHPLTLLSHMLDCTLFGLAPRGHHLTSLALHAACVVLLFEVLRRMTGAPWRSAAVAALFAVHPTHVESVAWVAERKDVLCAFFWLLALAAYLRYARRPALGRYLLVALCFALALLAKPMAVTLPLVLLLLDFWPLDRWEKPRSAFNPLARPPEQAPAAHPVSTSSGAAFLPRVAASRLLLEKLPLLAMAAAAAAETFFAQGAARAPEGAAPLARRLGNALISYATYLRQTFWPGRLAVFYPFPSSVSAAKAAAAALLLAVLLVAALLLARRAPYLAVGWLWFVGTLAPVIGLVQVGSQAMADRYTYLPSIGLLIAAVWGLADLAGAFACCRSFRLFRDSSQVAGTPGRSAAAPACRGTPGRSAGAFASRGRRASVAARAAGFAVVALAAGALAVATRAQIATWKDSVALFRHDLAVAGESSIAELTLAEALRAALPPASPAAASAGADHAALPYPLFEPTRPSHPPPGAPPGAHGAAPAMWSAAPLAPSPAPTRSAVSASGEPSARSEPAERSEPSARSEPAELLRVGAAMREVETHYARAVALAPDRRQHAVALAAWGGALRSWGRPAEALPRLSASLRWAQDDVRTHLTLAMTLSDLHRDPEAIAELRRALLLAPNSIRAHYGLAVLLAGRGRTEEAIGHYERALDADPGLVELYPALASLLAARGRLEQAAAALERGVALHPGSAPLHLALASVRARQGRTREAYQELALARRVAAPPPGPER